MAKWNNLGSRGDVEDRRDLGNTARFGGAGALGIGILLLVNYLNGGSLIDVLPQILETQLGQEQRIAPEQFEGSDEYEVFASTVLGSANDMWAGIFAQNNRTYSPPTLVLFRDGTESSCGGASSEVGPHYCPLDKTIYLDETFFEELQNRLGAQGGDVAEAYVIAHEVGHHVQHELGILGADRTDNETSIKVELQADCFAGLWANSLRDKEIFEQGEIVEAMDAASAVGDDRIQKTSTGRINPESWTHGSSEQRVSSFTRGFEQGTFASCTL